VSGWPDRSIPAATAAATPSAMAAAVAGAIATSVTATAAAAVVAALPGGIPLPAMPVPSMLGIKAAAITHPCLLVTEPLTTSAAGTATAPRAAIPSFLPSLAPWGRVASSTAIATCAVRAAVAAAAAVALWAAGSVPVTPVAVTPGALPSGRVRSRIRGCWSFFRARCYLL
jgi:hypothetical protein